jgi:hypothetical protein
MNYHIVRLLHYKGIYGGGYLMIVTNIINRWSCSSELAINTNRSSLVNLIINGELAHHILIKISRFIILYRAN